MNKQQIIKQQENMELVKGIIKTHKTHDVNKIREFLLGENNLSITKRSIRRYLILIDLEPKKKIKKINKIVPKAKPAIKVQESKYPYTIYCPAGKPYQITGSNMTVTIGFGESGRLITYDTKDKLWRYDSNGHIFNKAKPEKSYHKRRSWLCFEYDNL